MNTRGIQTLATTFFLALLVKPLLGAGCESLAKLSIEHVTITAAETIKDGSFTPRGAKPITGLPEFCRVEAIVRPVKDSAILVEVWLPAAWNERIEGTGNGGFAGGINYGPMINGVQQGYAVANTDMGMAIWPETDVAIFVGRPERWADWGYRATHEMTVLTKELVVAFYGREAKKSYFTGCSTGGEQAMMESQRYPDDYDGIVGGAPANNRTGVHQSILWNFAVPQKTPASYLPPEKLNLLAKTVLNACDALDGVKDGLIANPLACHFDPAVLVCKDKDAADCLTPPQVETAKAIYAGPVDPKTGASIYPGLEPGSEPKWDNQVPKPGSSGAKVPYQAIFEWVLPERVKNWDWRGFDFGRDVVPMNQKLGGVLNATSPDIDTFRAHGHKLLIYHGWNDPLVPPGESIRYYEAAVARVPAAELSSSYRLFMVPGMEHCGGGPGPSGLHTLDALVAWVEKGIAPESMIATGSFPVAGGPAKVEQRLLCPYPQVAHYKGNGDVDLSTSYVCSR